MPCDSIRMQSYLGASDACLHIQISGCMLKQSLLSRLSIRAVNRSRQFGHVWKVALGLDIAYR